MRSSSDAMYSLFFSLALLTSVRAPPSLLASAEGEQCLQLLQINLDDCFALTRGKLYGVLLLQERVALLGHLCCCLSVDASVQ